MASVSPKIRFRDQQIEMARGAGGKASRRLIEGLFAPLLFDSPCEPLGLGYDGGEIDRRGLADHALVVPCDYIPRIEEPGRDFKEHQSMVPVLVEDGEVIQSGWQGFGCVIHHA